MNLLTREDWITTVQVSTEVELQNAINTAANTRVNTLIELLNDIDLTKSLNVPVGATIKLTSANSAIDNYVINAGNQGFRVINMTLNGSNDTTLYLGNITLTGGNTINNTSGGAINGDNSGGAAYIVLEDNALIDNNSAYDGGAINLYKGHVTMLSGTISNNTASNGGGAINIHFGIESLDNEAINIQDGIITNNKARIGGAFYESLYFYINIIGGTLSNNTANSGGALYCTQFKITGGSFINNTATTTGGAIFMATNGIISGDVIFSGNTSGTNGGAIYIGNYTDSSLHVDGALFSNNQANGNGGAIWTDYSKLGVLTIGPDTKFGYNSASSGYKLRHPEDDAMYYANILATVWTTPFTQGYNNYDISYDGLNPGPEPEPECETTGYQTVDVCLPVTIKPFANVGTITTKCCGEPIIKAGTNICTGTINGDCNFTISQRICVAVPVKFGANATSGEPHVGCSNEDCSDCNSPGDE